jgi:gamma-glutamyl phosphate reductase
LLEAIEDMQAVLDVSTEIRLLIEAGDLDAANTLFQEETVPLFNEIWGVSHTLISEAERKFPIR